MELLNTDYNFFLLSLSLKHFAHHDITTLGRCSLYFPCVIRWADYNNVTLKDISTDMICEDRQQDLSVSGGEGMTQQVL